jgi:hypothetical protein
MVDAISALLHTPSDLAKQQGAANRVHARQHGSLSTVIDAVIYCYERLSGPA